MLRKVAVISVVMILMPAIQHAFAQTKDGTPTSIPENPIDPRTGTLNPSLDSRSYWDPAHAPWLYQLTSAEQADYNAYKRAVSSDMVPTQAQDLAQAKYQSGTTYSTTYQTTYDTTYRATGSQQAAQQAAEQAANKAANQSYYQALGNTNKYMNSRTQDAFHGYELSAASTELSTMSLGAMAGGIGLAGTLPALGMAAAGSSLTASAGGEFFNAVRDQNNYLNRPAPYDPPPPSGQTSYTPSSSPSSSGVTGSSASPSWMPQPGESMHQAYLRAGGNTQTVNGQYMTFDDYKAAVAAQPQSAPAPAAPPISTPRMAAPAFPPSQSAPSNFGRGTAPGPQAAVPNDIRTRGDNAFPHPAPAPNLGAQQAFGGINHPAATGVGASAMGTPLGNAVQSANANNSKKADGR